MEIKFKVCRKCGNMVGMINDSGVPIKCCGEDMETLIPNTVEASNEKHIPVVSYENNTLTVTVGSVEHPMQEEHYIEWIYVRTENGGQRKNLRPGDAPQAVFSLNNEKPIAVYAYCNLHGLWMTEM